MFGYEALRLRPVERFLDPEPGWIDIGGPDHLMYVTGLAVVAATLIGLRGSVRRHRRLVRRAVLAVAVLQQIGYYVFAISQGWDWAIDLPLHVSRVTALLGVVYLATGSRRVMDLHFYLGLWAWISFSYPQDVEPADTLRGVNFWINHVLTLLMPVLAVITTDWRPRLRALPAAFGVFTAIILAARVANEITGGNYAYQRDQPLLPDVPSPVYLGLTLLAGLALFGLGQGVWRLVLGRRGAGAGPVGPL